MYKLNRSGLIKDQVSISNNAYMAHKSPKGIYETASNYSVETQNLCKTFSTYRSQITMFKLLKSSFGRNTNNGKRFLALNDINIKVNKGEKIGVIGNNGSGKTTFLRLLAGLYKPNRGKVIVNGKIVLLAGFGIGMIDELSVKENVFLYSAIYGMDRNIIKENLGEILEWAELQDFVEAKLKTLSTGMKSRLAFSTAKYVESDILLLDEALSAGDKSFKKKCEKVLEHYQKNERTIMASAHDFEFLKSFCDKVLWLHKGKQMAFDKAETVLEQYYDFMNITPKNRD